MSGVVNAIIFHEQVQSDLVCCFQTLDAVCSKDLFSGYFSDHDSCRFAVRRSEKVSPYIDTVFYCF